MKHKEYYQAVSEQLERQVTEEEATIEEAAQICAASVCADRLIHAFGCGHSQMFAMEIFYRTGGLVPVNALLLPHTALFPKAKLSTIQERMEGFASTYLDLEDTAAEDTMIIVSISGRNAMVIDMALAAKAKGMKVIALLSREFSDGVSSRHSSGKKLGDVADVVIDIKCVSGDACMAIEGISEKFGGTSTILGMTVIQMIMVRTVEICLEKGYTPDIWVSSNLDQGDQHNIGLIAEYGKKIDCL